MQTNNSLRINNPSIKKYNNSKQRFTNYKIKTEPTLQDIKPLSKETDNSMIETDN